MSADLNPIKSLLVRLLVLFLGLLFLALSIFAAVQRSWVALIFLGSSVHILRSWWRAHRASRGAAGPAWPPDVPRLYPKLDGVRLCEYMSPADFESIGQFPIVTMLPLTSEHASREDMGFGRGLQLLMIRDLMLVPNISVHGPEDIPTVFLETARELAENDKRSIYVAGNATSEGSGFHLELFVHRPGGRWTKASISSVQFDEFLYKVAATIAEMVSGQVNETVLERWRVARPSTAESLSRYGLIQLSLEGQEQSDALLQLAQDDPTFGLPLGSIDSDDPKVRRYLLEAFRRDPFDAQLCFSLFCRIWQSRGWEAAAMQFSRRAIELSPGHGKAHMCAPHAAHPDAKMLAHSELGYRLLPGNPFAVNNYILNLNRSGAPPEKLIALAWEGIYHDPADPGNYNRLIELHCGQSQFSEALAIAEQLQALYEPEMNERTLYCLKQNPRMAEWIDSGQYDPAAGNRQRIAELRIKVQR